MSGRGTRLGLAAFASILLLFVLFDARISATWAAIESEYAYAPALLGGAVIAFLAADSILPVPSILVLAAAGIGLGSVTGTVVGAIGLNVGCLLAYAVGVMAAKKGSDDPARSVRASFWIVALTRAVPMLAELVCMRAGYRRMKLVPFVVAITGGNIAFAAVVCFVTS